MAQPVYTKTGDERSGAASATLPSYRVTRATFANGGKHDAIILRALPRMAELPSDHDATHHARYWQEAYHGGVRMALLALGAVE
ncbi:MAG: hypothetical protein IT318_04065 [Anaerolineales bacterium]|nr:hypothetical protein [Anaerolineales bacterium]